jgi:hypothetical protein
MRAAVGSLGQDSAFLQVCLTSLPLCIAFAAGVTGRELMLYVFRRSVVAEPFPTTMQVC